MTAKMIPIIRTTIAEMMATEENHIYPKPNTTNAVAIIMAFDSANQQRARPTPLHAQQTFSS